MTIQPLEAHGTLDTRLSAATIDRIADGLAANTRAAYRRQLERFGAWCQREQRTALPCTAETLAEYVTHLANDAKPSPSSIEQAIAAIRTAHRLAGHDHQPDTGKSLLVLRSYRREYAGGGKRAKKAPPLVLSVLQSMVDACGPVETEADGFTVAGLRDRVLLVLGFALMGRRSELAALELGDLEETEDGLLVHIRMSKTDQDALGAEVAIPRGQHAETDPVRLVRAWRAVLAERGVTEGRVLRSVDRHGRIGAGVSGDGINRIVRAAAVRAGVRGAESFTAHSLRAGGATAAYKGGAAVSVIAEHGRWKPNSPVVLGYIRSVDKWQDNALHGVGL